MMLNCLQLWDENENESITNLRMLGVIRIALVEEIANREICEDFSKFKPLFQQIQSDLNKELEKQFFMKEDLKLILETFHNGGQKAFIFDIGKFFMQPYGIIIRLRIIFDNGTESGMLLRSFQRALVNDETAGKFPNQILALCSKLISRKAIKKVEYLCTEE